MFPLFSPSCNRPHRIAPPLGSGGFTLIEVLTVIVILAVLIGLLLPVFSQIKIAGQKAETISRLRAVHPMILAYANDRDGYLPPGHSDAKDPLTGRDYGTWMHSLNQNGYVSDPPLPSVKETEMFSSPRQLSQFTPTNGDLRTFAMNNRIGNHPTNSPQGARKFIQMAVPSKTALILAGPWRGTDFGTSTYENYRPVRMVWEADPTPSLAMRSMCFMPMGI